MIHELKCWPEFFEEVLSGRKKFEIRRMRKEGFRVGDQLDLREYVNASLRDDQPKHGYTGRTVRVNVDYVMLLKDVPFLFASQDDWVVMGISR